MLFFLFLGGLVSFLAGLYLMKLGLEKMALSHLKKIIIKFTDTPLKGFFTGSIITAIIQSSSAVTVITIGLVNAGLMTFPQSLGIILGTNIGTTVTAQLIAFDITKSAPYFLGLGLGLVFFKEKKIKYLGIASLGFGLIFLGLYWMVLATEPLKYFPSTKKILLYGSENSLFSIILSAFLTAVFQSSSAIIGITIALAQQNLLELKVAVAIVLGSNIGTCMTGVIAAAGANLAARRVALAHVILNVAGAVVFLPLIEPFSKLLEFTSSSLPRQIANAHLFYNVICSLLLLPFCNFYAKVIEFILKK